MGNFRRYVNSFSHGTKDFFIWPYRRDIEDNPIELSFRILGFVSSLGTYFTYSTYLLNSDETYKGLLSLATPLVTNTLVWSYKNSTRFLMYIARTERNRKLQEIGEL